MNTAHSPVQPSGPVLSTRSLVLALLCLVPMVIFWEKHWRAEGYPATPDATKHLWAENRAKLSRLGPKDVVIVGSSRVLFDLQIYEWETITGRRPLQLALPGATPMPVLQDVANNTDFAGTVIVGVTPGLFFQSVGPGRGSWDRPAGIVKHYYQRTWAERFNHWLGKPLQRTFAFLQSDDLSFCNELDLETLISRIPMVGRVEAGPPFPILRFQDKNRNVTMWDRVTKDTAYAGMIRRIWLGNTPGSPPDSAVLDSQRSTAIRLATECVERIEARGGLVIFVRCPSGGALRASERRRFPRTTHWDALLRETVAPGYHFEDYAFMQLYEPPELSHLATPDARVFTRDFVRQLQSDGLLR